MQLKFNNKLYDFPFHLLIFIILCITILCGLGFWQLIRLKDKNLLIEEINHNLNSAALEVQLNTDFFTPYQKIKIKGKFLQDQDIYLYGRKSFIGTQKKDGYYLISPFQIDNGEVIIVARGWFAQENKQQVSKITNAEYEEITGILLPGENKRLFVPDNDLQKRIWFTLDLKQISAIINYVTPHYYLFQLKTTNPVSLLTPLSANKLTKIRNDHLEYAITWFSLSICLLVISVLYIKKKYEKLTNFN